MIMYNIYEILEKIGFELIKTYKGNNINITFYKKHELKLDVVKFNDTVKLILPDFEIEENNKNKFDINENDLDKLEIFSLIENFLKKKIEEEPNNSFYKESLEMLEKPTAKQKINRLCQNCHSLCFNGYEYCDKHSKRSEIHREGNLKYTRKPKKCAACGKSCISTITIVVNEKHIDFCSECGINIAVNCVNKGL